MLILSGFVIIILIVGSLFLIGYFRYTNKSNTNSNNPITNTADQFFRTFGDVNNNLGDNQNQTVDSVVNNWNDLIETQTSDLTESSFSTYEISRMDEGVIVYRFPNSMLKPEIRKSIAAKINKGDLAMANLEHVFMYRDNKFYYNGQNIYFLSDFKYSGQTYWLSIKNDDTDKNLNKSKTIQISKPFYSEAKEMESFRKSDIIHASKINNEGKFYITVNDSKAKISIQVYEIDLVDSIKNNSTIITSRKVNEDESVTR